MRAYYYIPLAYSALLKQYLDEFYQDSNAWVILTPRYVPSETYTDGYSDIVVRNYLGDVWQMRRALNLEAPFDADEGLFEGGQEINTKMPSFENQEIPLGVDGGIDGGYLALAGFILEGDVAAESPQAYQVMQSLNGIIIEPDSQVFLSLLPTH